MHAIDLLPTLLEAIGIEPPAMIAGVAAVTHRGHQLRGDLTDGSAPGEHVTQYYEMLGSRALYHDGWKAVVFHPSQFLAYDGSDLSHPFDEDVWELYHVAEDFSEVARPRGISSGEAGRAQGPVVARGRALPGAPAQQRAGPSR